MVPIPKLEKAISLTTLHLANLFVIGVPVSRRLTLDAAVPGRATITATEGFDLPLLVGARVAGADLRRQIVTKHSTSLFFGIHFPESAIQAYATGRSSSQDFILVRREEGRCTRSCFGHRPITRVRARFTWRIGAQTPILLGDPHRFVRQSLKIFPRLFVFANDP